ncbi:MAG: hypothetical protein ACNA8H_02045 [Anaerolineales bacterium]
MKDDRGPWYLLTGVVLGIALGLFYSWVISPVEYVNTSPSDLRAEYKDQYRALVAMAFLYNEDLRRAQTRLDLLDDADIAQNLAEQAQRYLASGRDSQAAQALGLLAVAIGRGADQQGIPTPFPE